jgi:hypothetical protein
VSSWKIPLLVAAIAVPIVAGFGVGGGGGLAVGSIAVVVLVLVAVQQRPRGPIAGEDPGDGRRRVLLVVTRAVESPASVARIGRAAHLGEDGPMGGVLVLAPARIGFLDRWASDVEPARDAAQRSLVATVAALAKAGIEAEARVGDEDVVQAVEDQFQTFPATEVVLVSDAGDAAAEKAAKELGSRLEPEFQHLTVEGEAASGDL